MAQPSFAPVPEAGEVRPTVPTQPPEIGRAKNPGLLRHVPRSPGRYGNPAPNEGFALTLAARAVADLEVEHAHDREGLALAVGLVAAKRASLIGRGPTRGDVVRAMDLLGVRSPVPGALARRFRGLSHSYAAQRDLVDTVDGADLLVPSEGSDS
ncbi:MAG TPA: hypothetical protein PLS29_06505 [Acidimicrobiales bacterium]|nr:MAG: hypothetical protein B7Z69_05835 [Actinobacteria bacterium 21-73-9]HQU26667.1 hypothetical protein [Acidimicrobiales bacterium]